MNNYFKCTVKVEYETEKGVKYRKEDYIVSAINPTDVEKKITEHLRGTDFEVFSITMTKIMDIIK